MSNFLNYITNVEGRKFGLDLLRAIAILLVLISHSRHYLKPVIGDTSNYLSLGGFLGVELFFVLSGFLIGGILIKIFEERQSSITFHDIKEFWIRRWFRTLPNYYLILLINAIALSIIANDIIFDFNYLVFTQNLITPLKGEMNYGQSWSLTIEEWFYLLVPIFFFFIIKVFKLSAKTTVLIAIVVVIVFYPLVKFGYLFFVDNVLNKAHQINFNTFRAIAIVRLDSLMMGVVIAFLHFYYFEMIKKKSLIFFKFGILFFLILIFSYYFFRWNEVENPSVLVLIFFTPALNFSFALMLPYFEEMVTPTNNAFCKIITVTSIISYSLYLIHYSVVMPIVDFLSMPWYISFLFFWLITYLLSGINYRFYESRMTRLRERF